MAENKNENNPQQTLIEPYNVTDPKVWLDPNIKKSTIVKPYLEQPHGDPTENANNIVMDSNAKDNSSIFDTEQYQDALKVDGIYVPLIQLNNHVLDKKDIVLFTLHYDSFLPNADIVIKDSGYIKATDMPGLNNNVTVVLLPSVDGIYKKITLDMYIVDVQFLPQNMIKYSCEYKCLPLEQTHIEQLKKPSITNPETGKEIEMDNSSNKMNTFQYLYSIASNTGLGFAATDGCENVNDAMVRTVRGQKYKDYIKEQIRFSGQDENTIFDCWIDLYGYLVLVNVPYVMNSTVDANQLAIYALPGYPYTSSVLPRQKPILVGRTLTKIEYGTIETNLEIDTFKYDINMESQYVYGTLNTYHIMNLDGNGDGNNSITTKQIQTVENSIDGSISNDYEMQIKPQVIIESNSEPIVMQNKIREKYFDKLRYRYLIVRLKQPNFGLQRGTLVNVFIMEYDTMVKKQIISQVGNVYARIEDSELVKDNPLKSMIYDHLNSDANDVIMNQTSGIPNFALCDQYYIDKMTFDYDFEKETVTHTLFLIKKGPLTNYTNKYTFPNI